MPNVMEIVVEATDNASSVIEGVGDTADDVGKGVGVSVGKASDAFDDVGASAKKAGDDVGASAAGFDKAAEASDTVDTRAMGFRDTLTGLQDTAVGTGEIMKGNLFEGFFTLGMGIGDLASGFTNLLIPALGSAVSWLGKTKVGMLAQAAATKVVGAATKVWTGIQAAFNFVMALNPIILIVLAVIALIAVIIIAYQRSETFRKIVDGAFRWVLKTVQTVWHWIRDNWKLLLAIITGPIGIAVLLVTKHWGKIKSGASAAKNFIVRAFKGLGNVISTPFRAGFNAIRSAWNSTVGGFGFTVPAWIPKVGGKSFRIPKLHDGGVFRAPAGQSEGLALLRDMERVTTPEEEAETNDLLRAIVEHLRAGGGAPMVAEIHIEIGGEVVRVVRSEIRADRSELSRRARSGSGAAA